MAVETLYQKKIILLFVTIFLWQIIFNLYIFRQPVFYKYPINAQKFLDDSMSENRFLDFSPLYLFLNIFLCKAGLEAEKYLVFFQLIIANLGLVLFFLIMIRYVSNKAAVLSVVLVALYPSYNFYSSCLEPEIFIFIFTMAGLYFSLVNGKGALSGLFFSLSFLTRPSGLPFILLAGLIQKKQRVMYYVFVLASIGVMLTISLYMVGEPTLTFMSPGSVFFEGNNPHTKGIAPFYPKALKIAEINTPEIVSDYAHVIYRRVAVEEQGIALSLREQQMYWFKKAVNYILDYPLRCGVRFIKKAWYIFLNKEIHDIMSLVQVQRKLGIFTLFSFGLFTSIGFIGVISNLRKIPLIIYLGNAWFMLIIVIFYFTSRQRMSFLTFFIFISALGLEAIIKKWQLILPCVMVFLLTCLQPNEIKDYDRVLHEYGEASFLAKQAEDNARNLIWKNVIFYGSQSVRIAPYLHHFIGYSPRLLSLDNYYLRALKFNQTDLNEYNRGLLNLLAGNIMQAEYHFSKIKYEEIDYNFYATEPPMYYHIICQKILGSKINYTDLEWALKTFSGNAAVMSLGKVMGYDCDLLRYYDNYDAAYFQGMTCLYIGLYKEAGLHFNKMLEITPYLSFALEYSALCAGHVGDLEAMVELIGKYFELKSKKTLPLYNYWSHLGKNILKMEKSELQVRALEITRIMSAGR